MNIPVDFSKLPITARKFLSGTALLMPFFFLDIYLYHKSFYQHNPVYLSVVFSYCLSIGSLILSYMTESVKFFFKDEVKQKSSATLNNIIFSSLLLIIILNTAYIFIGNGRTFIGFFMALICSHFATMLLLLLGGFISSFTKEKNKVGKQLEINFSENDKQV